MYVCVSVCVHLCIGSRAFGVGSLFVLSSGSPSLVRRFFLHFLSIVFLLRFFFWGFYVLKLWFETFITLCFLRPGYLGDVIRV